MIWVVAACLAGFLLVCAAVGYLGKLKHTTEDIPQIFWTSPYII